MKSYKVTDPDTGTTLSLTSQDDVPPSPEELESVFKQHYASKSIGAGAKAVTDTLGAGTIEGGAGLLQAGQDVVNATNKAVVAKYNDRMDPLMMALKAATGGKLVGATPDQTLGNQATKARQYATNTGAFQGTGIPVGSFRKSVPGMITEGLAQTPAMVAEVEAAGGGVPGMATQGLLKGSETSDTEALKQGAVGAGLGLAGKAIGMIKTAPENMPNVTGKYGDLIGKTLLRSGLGAGVFGGTTALEGGSPKDIAASAGQGGIMTAGQTPYTPEEIANRLQLLKNKGYKASSEFIQPDVEEQARAKKFGGQHPAVEQTFQNVEQGPKTFEDTAAQLEGKAKVSQDVKDKLLAENPEATNQGYMGGLANELSTAYKNVDKPRATAYQKVHDAELQWQKENPNPTSEDLQDRKEYHQQKSKDVIETRAAGGDVRNKYTGMAHDLLRDGLKTQLEQIPGIEEANAPYGGLTTAANSLRTQGSEMQNAPQPGAVRKVLGKALPFLIENPVYRLGSIAQEISKTGESPSIDKRIKQIQTLREASQRLAGSMKPDQGTITKPEPLQLTGPGGQAQLPPPGSQFSLPPSPKMVGEGFETLSPEEKLKAYTDAMKNPGVIQSTGTEPGLERVPVEQPPVMKRNAPRRGTNVPKAPAPKGAKRR